MIFSRYLGDVPMLLKQNSGKFANSCIVWGCGRSLLIAHCSPVLWPVFFNVYKHTKAHARARGEAGINTNTRKHTAAPP